jgi:hypothetical protein
MMHETGNNDEDDVDVCVGVGAGAGADMDCGINCVSIFRVYCCYFCVIVCVWMNDFF